jgi:CRP-like cAMP-binding protein/CheY-like chemotaxis protein
MNERSKILVVEDESIVALDIKDSLESLGYDVVGTEAYGEKAVEKAKELSPELILMDIMLKGELDGIGAAAQIWDACKIPVIFLTAYGDESTLQRAKIVEPFGYLLKPFEPRELRAGIEMALHRIKSMGPTANASALAPAAASEEITGEGGQSADSIKRFLARVQVFSDLSDADLSTLAGVATFKRYANGDVVFDEGDKLESGRVICSGRIALVKASTNGKQLIVELLPAGDILPLVHALDGSPAPWSARAQVPSSLIEIPLTTLKIVTERNPSIYRTISHFLGTRLQDSHNRARAFAHDSVEVRIAATLSALIPHFSKSSRENEDIRSIVITRQELADITGTTPETAIRITKNMERENILDLARPGIIKILDSEALVTLTS